MEHPMAISWLAVIVAAIVKFAIGAAWYMPLFGARYRALMKVPEGAPPEGLTQGMVIGFIGDLIMAYVLARFAAYYGAANLFDGIVVGFMAWLGFVATLMAGSVYYERKPWELVYINGGYQLVGIVVMGAIFGIWHG